MGSTSKEHELNSQYETNSISLFSTYDTWNTSKVHEIKHLVYTYPKHIQIHALCIWSKLHEMYERFLIFIYTYLYQGTSDALNMFFNQSCTWNAQGSSTNVMKCIRYAN